MLNHIIAKYRDIGFFRKSILKSEYKKFRAPRIWSNSELRKFVHLFTGSIVNISGWTDVDKEGGHYKDYFCNATEYFITNFSQDYDRGSQGMKDEINLNLEDTLSDDLIKKFDIALCHTVLEHIFDIRKAFSNICMMTKKAVITIVPYMQQIHGMSKYVSDFWRFTPMTMKHLYDENGLTLRYCSSNGASSRTSIYLFCIGYWKNMYDADIPYRFDLKLKENSALSSNNVIGANLIR